MQSFLRTVAVLALLTCLLPRGSAAQHAVSPRVESLQGIPGFYLLGADLNPALDLGDAPLSKRIVLGDVERALREAQINVMSEMEWMTSESSPVLHIDLTLERNAFGWFTFGLRLEVLQLVVPTSNPDATSYAVVWSTSDIGVMPPEDVARVRTHVRDLAEELVAAYAEANAID